MNEFRHVLNEKCTGCQMNDRNQLEHELCLLASVQEQVNICFEEAVPVSHILSTRESYPQYP